MEFLNYAGIDFEVAICDTCGKKKYIVIGEGDIRDDYVIFEEINTAYCKTCWEEHLANKDAYIQESKHRFETYVHPEYLKQEGRRVIELYKLCTAFLYHAVSEHDKEK
jgi:hypothetical protein